MLLVYFIYLIIFNLSHPSYSSWAVYNLLEACTVCQGLNGSIVTYVRVASFLSFCISVEVQLFRMVFIVWQQSNTRSVSLNRVCQSWSNPRAYGIELFDPSAYPSGFLIPDSYTFPNWAATDRKGCISSLVYPYSKTRQLLNGLNFDLTSNKPEE